MLEVTKIFVTIFGVILQEKFLGFNSTLRRHKLQIDPGTLGMPGQTHRK